MLLGEAEEARRILAVDDNPYTLRVIELALAKEGYEVATAASGQDALQMIEQQGLPHLALVDLNMPRMNGFEFAQAVHRFSDLPLVMLTAVFDEETIIQCIEEFAEDYITKPFSPRELVARPRRVLLRIGSFAYTLDPLARVDNHLQVNLARRRAFVDGKEVSLTPTETKLLYVLMRNAGRNLSSSFLLRRMWPLETVYEERLHVHIHRLRHKIETVPTEPRYIISERGRSYRFPAAATP